MSRDKIHVPACNHLQTSRHGSYVLTSLYLLWYESTTGRNKEQYQIQLWRHKYYKVNGSIKMTVTTQGRIYTSSLRLTWELKFIECKYIEITWNLLPALHNIITYLCFVCSEIFCLEHYSILWKEAYLKVSISNCSITFSVSTVASGDSHPTHSKWCRNI